MGACPVRFLTAVREDGVGEDWRTEGQLQVKCLLSSAFGNGVGGPFVYSVLLLVNE